MACRAFVHLPVRILRGDLPWGPQPNVLFVFQYFQRSRGFYFLYEVILGGGEVFGWLVFAKDPLTIYSGLFSASRSKGRWSLYLSCAVCRFPSMPNGPCTEAPEGLGEPQHGLSAHLHPP